MDADLVKLAGGPAAVVKLATDRIAEKREVEALRLTDAALAADPASRVTWEARAKALERLIVRTSNTNERGWLENSLRIARGHLGN